MNLDNLIKPLSEYYGLEVVEEAIKTLKQWYEDEAYDEEDIISDWQSDAFHDAEGIDKLVEALKFDHLINNEENKRTLYIYCCYYLLPDQEIPIKQPIKYDIDDNKPINKIYQEFKSKLKETLDFNAVDAKQIGDVFLYHIKEEEYDMEAIEGDLEHEDESEIIDNIIEKFPKLENQKTKIFDILSSIINIKPMPIYEDLALKMQSTQQQKDEVVSLCKEWFDGIFQDQNGRWMEEKSFIIVKSWDINNQFPWLSSICDTFTRFKLESHKKSCEENKNNEPNIEDKFITMSVEKWFTEIDPECNKLIQIDSKKANYLKYAMIALFKLMPTPNLNYILDSIIWDSLDVFARYAISINEFIYTISTSSILQCTPIQFDFLIIPKCCSKSMYVDNDIAADELFQALPSFMRGNNNIKQRSLQIEYTSFSQEHEIWDIEENNLIPSGYVKDKDYFGPVLVKQEIININKMVNIFINDLFRKIKGANNTRFNRYIIVIDRRNPKNLRDKKMTYTEEYNKNWSDRMYLICPKQANKICPEYQYKMNEIFMYNSRKCVIPLPNVCSNPDLSDFGALSSGNGYKFLLSHHIYSQEKVKTYWYLGAGGQRFFIDDIEWLWSRFFVKENKHENFQQLTENTKQALQRAQNQHRLLDKQFTRYRQGYKVIT